MKHVTMWLLALLLLPAVVFAQTGSIEGSVIDAETLEPLPGANVLVTDLAVGAATDIDGNYSIAGVPAGTYTLRITFIGYTTLERAVTVGNSAVTVDVSLDPDYAGLEEVVVTGIASRRSRATADVAVSRISAEDLLESASYQDLSQLVNGKVTGVTVQPASGNVAGGIRFNMRAGTGLNGNGQPIVYVDGVRVESGQTGGFGVGGQQSSFLAMLNPEDIESIDILKGPAGAALYGTSGSNGVVLITTKKGALAAGPSTGPVPLGITYKSTLGSNSQANEYTPFNAGAPDMANAFFREGQIAEHSIEARGGSDVVRFFTSYSKRLEEGHIRNNRQDRQSFRANFQAFPTADLTLNANAGYTYNEVNRPQNDNNIFGYLGNTLLASSPFVFTDSTAIEELENLQRLSSFVGGLDAEYRPIKGLRLRAAVGYNYNDIRNDASYPSNLSYSGRTNGERNVFDRRSEQFTYDFTAAYSYNILPNLAASTTIGSQSFNRIFRSFNFTKQNFSSELVTNIGAGADFIGGDEGFSHTRSAGVFVAQELDYNQQLFVTLGLRRDYSSAVGFEAPSIYYPRASAALRLDNLIELPSMINFLKARVAYGEAGQLPGTLDGQLLLWEAEPSGYGTGAVLSRIGNPEIEPERISELEMGFEADAFNSKLGLEFTYYRQKAKNSIIGFENPPSSGLSATDVPINIGESKGSGVEMAISAVPIRTRNMGLDVTLMLNWQDNEVMDLGGAQPIFSGFDVGVVKEGFPQDAFYTWSSRATFNDDGSYAGAELTTTDADGDGEVDRAFFGVPYAEDNGSLSINFRFLKNFTISALADWQRGLRVYNNTHLFSRRFGAFAERNIARVQIGQVDDPCSVGLCDDDGNLKPDFSHATPLPVGSDEYRAAAEVVATTEVSLEGKSLDGNWIEDADFLKLREVSIRYDFTDLLNKSSLNRYVRTASFRLAGRNLFMSSPYSGADPEVNFTGASSSTRASDFLTLPQPKVIYGTLTIGF